jgi:hypothetical protein
MSESDLDATVEIDLGGSINDTMDDNNNTDDDKINSLIQEAKNLMHDLDSETDKIVTPTSATPGDGDVASKNSPPLAIDGIIMTGAFSIDDDDDEDGLMVRDPLQAPPPVKTETNDSLTTATAAAEVAKMDDHPLSEVQLSSSASPTSPPVGTTGGVQNIFTNGASAAMFSMQSQMNHFQHNMSGGGSGGTPVSMDVLTKKTSMFASNLASMAQRGIAQVAAATAPVTAVNVVGGPSVGSQQSLQQTYNGVATAMTGTAAMYPSPAPTTGIPTYHSTGGGNSSNELDKEQKAMLLKEHVGDLLPGERIIMFLSNLLHVSDTSGASFVASQSQDGTMWCCVMTYYRLFLFSTSKRSGKVEVPTGWDPHCWPDPPSSCTKLLEMPLASMDRVEKLVYQAAGSSYMGLVVHGKDCGRIIRFTTPSYADTGRAFESLNTYAFPGRRNLGYLFAFESKRQQVMASIKMDETTGQQAITIPPIPKRFDPMIEYPRLMQATSITQSPWALWASVNSTYQLSQSYPSVLVGPASLDETKPESLNVIRQCAAFRSEQRLPSMTWCGVGGSSIWRSSQPKVGLQGNRSSADELYIRHISESARGANAMAEPPSVYPRSILQQLTGDAGRDWVPEPGCSLKILDLRPRSSAMANRTGGTVDCAVSVVLLLS